MKTSRQLFETNEIIELREWINPIQKNIKSIKIYVVDFINNNLKFFFYRKYISRLSTL